VFSAVATFARPKSTFVLSKSGTSDIYFPIVIKYIADALKA